MTMNLQMIIYDGDYADIWMWVSQETGRSFGIVTKNGVWVDISGTDRTNLSDVMESLHIYENEELNRDRIYPGGVA